MTVAKECPAVGVPRVTGIAIDPLQTETVWVGLEVDGFRRSRNGGDSWEVLSETIPNRDVHAVVVTAGPPKSVFLVVDNDVYISQDDGVSWTPITAKHVFPWTYTRNIALHPTEPAPGGGGCAAARLARTTRSAPSHPSACVQADASVAVAGGPRSGPPLGAGRRRPCCPGPRMAPGAPPSQPETRVRRRRRHRRSRPHAPHGRRVPDPQQPAGALLVKLFMDGS